jgi:hypothetical protein
VHVIGYNLIAGRVKVATRLLKAAAEEVVNTFLFSECNANRPRREKRSFVCSHICHFPLFAQEIVATAARKMGPTFLQDRVENMSSGLFE